MIHKLPIKRFCPSVPCLHPVEQFFFMIFSPILSFIIIFAANFFERSGSSRLVWNAINITTDTHSTAILPPLATLKKNQFFRRKTVLFFPKYPIFECFEKSHYFSLANRGNLGSLDTLGDVSIYENLGILGILGNFELFAFFAFFAFFCILGILSIFWFFAFVAFCSFFASVVFLRSMHSLQSLHFLHSLPSLHSLHYLHSVQFLHSFQFLHFHANLAQKFNVTRHHFCASSIGTHRVIKQKRT